jgi:hypothetical protein
MEPERDGNEAEYRLAIRARTDRRRAEALALEFRQRLKELGFHGVTVTVAPDDSGGVD